MDAEVPLVAGSLYGLRTWRVVSDGDREQLAAPHRGSQWPSTRGWVQARCEHGHVAPATGCRCGIHAWHPNRRAARRVLAGRFELPGIVEAQGAVEVHVDGFRAERARPYAFIRLPNRNPFLIDRLSAAYGAEVIVLRRPQELLELCHDRGLGLEERVVEELLGPAAIDEHRRDVVRTRRTDRLRAAAALAMCAAGIVVTHLH